MKCAVRLLLVPLLLAAAECAFAQPGTVLGLQPSDPAFHAGQMGAAPYTGAARAAPAKRICVSQPDTGSILPREVCHTAAEWAAIQRDQLNTTRSGPAVSGMVIRPPR